MANNVFYVQLSDTGSKSKYAYNLLVATVSFIFVLPHLLLFAVHPKKELILSDVGTIKNLILSLIFSRHYRNLFYYRIGNIKYFIKWLLPEDRTIHVPVNLQMGKAAHFVHNISTFLNAESIGDNFTCYHHVTLGDARLGSTRRPVLGNNVTVYTGAVIVGGVTIGDNVNIGANSVVVKNVPPDCTVVGCPATIIKMNGQKVNIPL